MNDNNDNDHALLVTHGNKTIARNCHDIPIWNSLFDLLVHWSFCLFAFLSFCDYDHPENNNHAHPNNANLHVQPDVPLLELPGLRHPRATSVRPGVRSTDISHQQTVAFDHKLFSCKKSDDFKVSGRRG